MSTFTMFNGPGGREFSSRDLLNLIEAYNQLSLKLNNHIAAIAPTDPVVHGIKAALDALRAELENAISLRATKNELNDVRADVQTRATQQALQNAQQSLNALIATKADASVLPTKADKVTVNQLQAYVDEINNALRALEVRWIAYCQRFDEGDNTRTLFRQIVETVEHFKGELWAKDRIEFTEWKLFSAQFAGTGSQNDTTTNGLYILGEMSQLWTKQEPDVEKVKSAVAFVKYVNDRPFDAIVNMTATSFTDGALTVLYSHGAREFTHLKFHLIVNTDRNGVNRVYLAVSADELKSQSTEFRVAGVNFIPGGNVNGVVNDICTVPVLAEFNTHTMSSVTALFEQAGIGRAVVDTLDVKKVTTENPVEYNILPVHDTGEEKLPFATEKYSDDKDTELYERITAETDEKVQTLDEKIDATDAANRQWTEETFVKVADVQDEVTEDSENPVKSSGIYSKIREAFDDIWIANVPIGEMMYWPVSECVERECHSDHPFVFTWRGQQYSVEPEDPVVRRLDISTHIPPGFHACDGTMLGPGEEYPELAAFLPDNVDKDGNIWLPYVKKTIIKVKDVRI